MDILIGRSEQQTAINAVPFSGRRDYLDTLFRVETIRLQCYYNLDLPSDESGTPGLRNRFLPAGEDIGCLLERRVQPRAASADYDVMADWDAYFQGRLEAGRPEALPEPECLFRRVGLTAFGRSAAALVLMAVSDKDLGTILRYFGGESERWYPTPELCSRIYFGDRYTDAERYEEAVTAFSALPLLFPPLADSSAPMLEPMIPDRRLVSLLMEDGSYFPDALELYMPEKPLEPLFFQDKMLQALESYLGMGRGNGCCLTGEPGAGKHHLMRHLCRKLGRTCVFMSFNDLPVQPEAADADTVLQMRIAVREAVLQDAVLAVDGLFELEKPARDQLLRRLMSLTGAYKIPLFLFSEHEDPDLGGLPLTITLPMEPLDEAQRLSLWMYYGREDCLDGDIRLSDVANTFQLTPAQICSALEAARLLAGGSPISHRQLYQACYSQVDHKLAAKARRVRTVFGWDDLKLPKEEKGLLRQICNRIKNKHIVLSQWGYSALLPYGGGISAVFAGPPGTGKTMAAQVIARELGMELYQIDLSQLMDKYIGETEKNIRMIFDEAKKSNSILFFDEADALFGKRIESVGSSNDRFANIESSMLLQCVEQYSGVSILATNNYSAMDPAFIRRFKYLVNFHMPDADLRLEIWKSMLLPDIPVAEEVNLKWFAEQFPLSGAYIKNIVLTAAFLAAEEGTAVNNLFLLMGLKQELIKEGRQLDISQIGPYAYLYGEL
jgi:hypothetical protein